MLLLKNTSDEGGGPKVLLPPSVYNRVHYIVYVHIVYKACFIYVFLGE